jgi:hypothetical protein
MGASEVKGSRTSGAVTVNLADRITIGFLPLDPHTPINNAGGDLEGCLLIENSADFNFKNSFKKKNPMPFL